MFRWFFREFYRPQLGFAGCCRFLADPAMLVGAAGKGYRLQISCPADAAVLQGCSPEKPKIFIPENAAEQVVPDPNLCMPEA